MSAPAPSPNRGPHKVTYAGRAKRRRSNIDRSYKDTGGDFDGESDELEEEQTTQPATKMAARTPKKVDVHLPGPSPKRAQNQTPGQTASAKKPTSTKGKRAGHSRAGSVASLAREGTVDASELSPMKPLSKASAKPRSQIQRTDTEEADDASAPGESKGRYASRKNEAERRQFLEEDPNSGEVEAHRAFCKACDKWIELNPTRRYIMKNWVEHRKQCKEGSERSESPSKEKEVDELADDVSVPAAVTAPVGDIFTTATKRIKKEDDRKAILENDPLSGEVKHDQIFCKGCQTWVKLSKETRYSLHPWRLHLQKCASATDDRPGARVATAQRKLQLVNDSQVKAFTARVVECKFCDDYIELESTLEYDLTKWDEHKVSCNRPVGSKPSIRSPPSITSTEETVVATDASTPRGTPRKSKKRSREDDDVPDRAVRQRGASYEPPQGDAPGFLDWITAPLKNFFRGFREGLSG